jgi:hypothetical protein
MTKKAFIQQIVIRALPPIVQLSATIQYAEQLWENLTIYGYGADVESKPQELKDYYELLTAYQRTAFDQFWEAFQYKKGRNEAAMRWWQMGELTHEQYHLIIEAAKQEAKQSIAVGQTRKWAQGWLTERRYEDFKPNPNQQRKQRDLTWVNLNNELNNLKRLYQLSPSPEIQSQIQAMEAKIRSQATLIG